MAEIDSTAPKPFVFVLMPFDVAFKDIYEFGIKGAASDAGAYAERVDEQIFNEGILERIFNQISKADVIVADMTGRNPNVFYEVGYAHALNKIVLLLTQRAEDIPFDLKHRQHIVYGGQIRELRAQLAERLAWGITEARERGRRKSVADRLTVHLLETELPEASAGMPVPTVRITEWEEELVFSIRNEGYEDIGVIPYGYLFTEGDPLVVPAYRSSGGLYELTRLLSSESDRRTLGLPRQYRLMGRLDSIPPGAVDGWGCNLRLTRSRDEVKLPASGKFCLRLQARSGSLDFPFQLIFESKA